MKTFIFLIALCFAQTSQATFSCVGQTKYGPVSVDFNNDLVSVNSPALFAPHFFSSLTIEGNIITAPGLAIFLKYQGSCVSQFVIMTTFKDPGVMDIMTADRCFGGRIPPSCNSQKN